MNLWRKLPFWGRVWLGLAVAVYVLVDAMMLGGMTLPLLTVAWVVVELTFDMVMTVVPVIAGALTGTSESFLRATGLLAGWGDESILLAAWALSIALWVPLGLLALWWVRLLLKQRKGA